MHHRIATSASQALPSVQVKQEDPNEAQKKNGIFNNHILDFQV